MTTGKKALITGITGQDGSYLAEAVAEAVGYKGVIQWDTTKPDGTPKKQLEVSRMQALGWSARITLAEGLASTVALFQEQLRQNLSNQLVRL